MSPNDDKDAFKGDLSKMEKVEPQKVIPTYPKDFNTWSKERQITFHMDMAILHMSLGMGLRCPTHGMSNFCFGCDHVLQQDKQKPDGLWLLSPNLAMCKWCFHKLERKRLDVGKTMKTMCFMCVIDLGVDIAKISPDKFHNLVDFKFKQEG